MGGYLDKPIKEKNVYDGAAHGLKYGMADMQGWSKYMEDTHYVAEHLDASFDKWSFFAVFDGHGGDKVSKHAALRMKDVLVESMKAEIENETSEVIIEVKMVEKASKDAFKRLDQEMREKFQNENVEEKEKDKSGSTAVCLLVSPRHIYLINCGDSRGVIFGHQKPTESEPESKEVPLSTIDHKPTLVEEKKRIVAAGGVVLKQRVNGCLAVSRALGDFEYKEDPENPIVSAEPDVFVWDRKSDSEEEFVVLACDGIWDVLTNDDIIDFVQWKLLLKDKLSDICGDAIDTCLSKASRDNMTMILVVFEKALVKMKTEENIEAARNKEKRLGKLIKDAVDKHLGGVNSPDDLGVLDLFNAVKKQAEEDDFKDYEEFLPEGGRNYYLYAMRNFIEAIYNERFKEELEKREVEERKKEEEAKKTEDDAKKAGETSNAEEEVTTDEGQE